MNRALLAALVLPLAALSACGSSDEEPSGANTSLKPAHDVNKGEAVALGEFIDLGNGIRAQASAPKVGGDDDGAWLEVPVRVENSSDTEGYMPSVAIHCANSNEGGGYQASSTISLSDTVPAGTFKEGVLNLLLPGDSRTGTAVTPCEGDAYLKAEPQGLVPNDSVGGRWALDAAVVDELNAAATK